MKILVIDDNPVHQTAAHQQLSTKHDLTVVGTHDEAHELLSTRDVFDVVLCDLLMPAGMMRMGSRGEKYIGQEMPVGFALSLMAVMHGARYVAVVTATNHHDHPASAMIDPFASNRQDWLIPEGVSPHFTMNGAKVGYYHWSIAFVEGTVCPDCNGTGEKDECSCCEHNDGSPKSDCNNCNGVGRYCWLCGCTGRQRGKDWGKVLAHLIES